MLRCIRDQDEWDFIGFREALRSVRTNLIEYHDAIFVELVEELLDRVALFGSHFASIDLRQDSREIKRAFDALLTQLNIPEPERPEELFTMQARWGRYLNRGRQYR